MRSQTHKLSRYRGSSCWPATNCGPAAGLATMAQITHSRALTPAHAACRNAAQIGRTARGLAAAAFSASPGLGRASRHQAAVAQMIAMGVVALRGRVPALACIARRVRPGIRPAAAHQSTGDGTGRGRSGSPGSDQAIRMQDALTAPTHSPRAAANGVRSRALPLSGLRIIAQDRPRRSPDLLSDLRWTPMDVGRHLGYETTNESAVG